jgi:chromatin structure-remodeling complex protein RSC7
LEQVQQQVHITAPIHAQQGFFPQQNTDPLHNTTRQQRTPQMARSRARARSRAAPAPAPAATVTEKATEANATDDTPLNEDINDALSNALEQQNAEAGADTKPEIEIETETVTKVDADIAPDLDIPEVDADDADADFEVDDDDEEDAEGDDDLDDEEEEEAPKPAKVSLKRKASTPYTGPRRKKSAPAVHRSAESSTRAERRSTPKTSATPADETSSTLASNNTGTGAVGTGTDKSSTGTTTGVVTTDKNGKPQYAVLNDEYQTEDDIKGDRKISALGVLQNGRRFRVKTFNVPGRGDRLYAISTDVARLVGYRDSYFLFQRHTSLFRVVCDEPSKMKLINDELLPVSFKTRAAYLITARSAYKEFGSKMIIDGRQVTDDYYEDRARANGAIEGALSNPSLNNDAPMPVADEQSMFERQRNIAQLLSNNHIQETETSWVFDHALKCRQFDSMLLYDRNELLRKKVQRDVYSNVNFVPSITQPTACKIKRLSNTGSGILMETRIGGFNDVKTGLASVPREVFEGTVDDETLQAILSHQEQEQVL